MTKVDCIRAATRVAGRNDPIKTLPGNLEAIDLKHVQNNRRKLTWRIKCLIAVALGFGAIFGALIILRLLGLFYPFYIPTGSMTPAVSAGDSVAMEGLTFLVRNPRRGDIVVFKSDHIPSGRPGTFYLKRVAGMPGEHLSIFEGNLFINGKLVTLSNYEGKIVYDVPKSFSLSFSPQTDVIVPEGCYFLLGDNWTNSLDSRYIGSIPRKEIVGRAVFCFWPPSRIGIVR